MTRTRHCDSCGRALRHPRDPKELHPGTAVMGNATTCTTCIGRARRQVARDAEPIRPCTECGTPTHPGKTAQTRPTGTSRRIGDGLCAGCYNARRRGRVRETPADLSAVPYIRARRRRGMPAEGQPQHQTRKAA